MFYLIIFNSIPRISLLQLCLSHLGILLLKDIGAEFSKVISVDIIILIIHRDRRSRTYSSCPLNGQGLTTIFMQRIFNVLTLNEKFISHVRQSVLKY